MRIPKFSWALALSLTIASALLAGGSYGLKAIPWTVHSGSYPIHFHSTDTLKHFGVVIREGTTIQWCRDDSDHKFTITFKSDTPFPGQTQFKQTSDDNPCTIVSAAAISPASGEGVDVYKYTLSMHGQQSIDPHIIVVGGTGPIEDK